MKRFAPIAAVLLSLLFCVVVFAQDLPPESEESPDITVFTGNSDQRIDVSDFRQPSLVRVWAYFAKDLFGLSDDGFNFSFYSADTPYYGEYLLNYLTSESSASLTVSAQGDWRIEILALTSASGLEAPGMVTGEGDRVVVLRGEPSNSVRIQTISTNDDKSNTQVYGYGTEKTLLFSTWADIDATVKMDEPIQVVTIKSSKKWTISVGNSEIISPSITSTSTPIPAIPTRRPTVTKTPTPTATPER